MSWDADQRRRLAWEKSNLTTYFPQFDWYNPTTSTYLSGYMRTNSSNSYGIWVILPTDYPDSPPKVYVFSPHPLPGNGCSLQRTSRSMHTQAPDSGGHVQICHYNSEVWTPSVTLYKVIVKVRLWLEAYEGHLATGKQLDHFLSHMD